MGKLPLLVAIPFGQGPKSDAPISSPYNYRRPWTPIRSAIGWQFMKIIIFSGAANNLRLLRVLHLSSLGALLSDLRVQWGGRLRNLCSCMCSSSTAMSSADGELCGHSGSNSTGSSYRLQNNGESLFSESCAGKAFARGAFALVCQMFAYKFATRWQRCKELGRLHTKRQFSLFT